MTQPDSNPFPGIFMLAGSVVLDGGIWWIYRPAAVVVAGLMLLALGLYGRRVVFGGGQ